jgi:hypothetical protein
MASQREQKRGLRRAAEAAGRGDRLPAPRPGGSGGGCGLWQDATLAELRLLRQAINQGWPVPPHRRGPILADVFAGLETTATRRSLAIARVILAAAKANLAGRLTLVTG